MKKSFCLFVFVLLSCSMFSQQTIRLENNTGLPINVFLIASGDSYNCIDCGGFAESNVFTLMPGALYFESFDDTFFNWNTPSCQNCSSAAATSFCWNAIWEMIGFSAPGSSGCCTARIGSSNCFGVNDYFSDGTFSATWTNLPSGDILVEFN